VSRGSIAAIDLRVYTRVADRKLSPGEYDALHDASNRGNASTRTRLDCDGNHPGRASTRRTVSGFRGVHGAHKQVLGNTTPCTTRRIAAMLPRDTSPISSWKQRHSTHGWIATEIIREGPVHAELSAASVGCTVHTSKSRLPVRYDLRVYTRVADRKLSPGEYDALHDASNRGNASDDDRTRMPTLLSTAVSLPPATRALTGLLVACTLLRVDSCNTRAS
jgi:hypothetical protein